MFYLKLIAFIGLYLCTPSYWYIYAFLLFMSKYLCISLDIISIDYLTGLLINSPYFVIKYIGYVIYLYNYYCYALINFYSKYSTDQRYLTNFKQKFKFLDYLIIKTIQFIQQIVFIFNFTHNFLITFNQYISNYVNQFIFSYIQWGILSAIDLNFSNKKIISNELNSKNDSKKMSFESIANVMSLFGQIKLNKFIQPNNSDKFINQQFNLSEQIDIIKHNMELLKWIKTNILTDNVIINRLNDLNLSDEFKLKIIKMEIIIKKYLTKSTDVIKSTNTIKSTNAIKSTNSKIKKSQQLNSMFIVKSTLNSQSMSDSDVSNSDISEFEIDSDIDISKSELDSISNSKSKI